jgi:hypothetical protein
MLTVAHGHVSSRLIHGVIPKPHPTVSRVLYLAHSVLTDDNDGIIRALERGAGYGKDVVGPDGAIWSTGRYEELDLGWLGATAEWMEHLIIGNHPFSTNPSVIEIPNACQIGIAGDFGTGPWRSSSNPAPSADVATHMAFLRPNITVHLGDTYYAGTDDEIRHNLLNAWPSGSIGKFALLGNHEIYSGADAYFDAISSLPQKGCSYFALENDHWVVVGLDTSYHADQIGLYLDGRLDDGQINFLRQQIDKKKSAIVLTHHNGLSLDGTTNTGLWNQVATAYPTPYPLYWYWGHVHAGVVYTDSIEIKPRCCGHGSLPHSSSSILRDSPVPRTKWFESRLAHDPDIPERVLNGFAMLYLDGDSLEEVWYDENGGVAWHS